MAYSKKTWKNGEVITDAALNNMEDGIAANDTALGNKADKSAIADMLTKTEAGETYATKSELGNKADTSALAAKAAKGSNIATADATDSASTETVDVAEFKAVVALVNACKSELNKMNA